MQHSQKISHIYSTLMIFICVTKLGGMYRALPKTMYYLTILIASLTSIGYFVSAHLTNTNISTPDHSSAHINPRWLPEIHCEWLRPAITNKHICYLGYQAVARDKDVNIDLSVWNQDCNKIGYATFVPPGKTYNLNSALPYVVVTRVKKAKSFNVPPSLDYAGKHFDGNKPNRIALGFKCYYPFENSPDMEPALWKMTIYCFVPFEC
ncbi:hypothetical protein VTL71DRAFT_3600 [Oculimacula yallundae]|uniref:Uncharacterized protein n=1 Tax=Oculimacula yallundae TaxID=86028 RepID=A0ABR4C7N7_9HELO